MAMLRAAVGHKVGEIATAAVIDDGGAGAGHATQLLNRCGPAYGANFRVLQLHPPRRSATARGHLPRCEVAQEVDLSLVGVARLRGLLGYVLQEIFQV